MIKVLQGRILFLTKIYFALLSVSAIVLVHRIDSSNSRQDMNYILECSKFNDLKFDEILENGIIEDNIYTYLRSVDSALWNKNKGSRETIVDKHQILSYFIKTLV